MTAVQTRLDRQLTISIYAILHSISVPLSHISLLLLNACRYGHVSEVNVLLSKGANLNYSDPDDPFGANCLSEASRRGKAEIVQLLIDRGIFVNGKISHDITALHLACERGHINVVQVLLDNGCSPDPAELFNLDTPLHYAAASDHDAICKLLVENGVDVNCQNRTGDTPLHIAVANDRSKSTSMLLEMGGDLAITNHAEMTPLIVGQLAKCKHAIDAMQPFVDKLKEETENKMKEEQQMMTESRKNTIKKTLDLGGMSGGNKPLRGLTEDDEVKYDDEPLSRNLSLSGVREDKNGGSSHYVQFGPGSPSGGMLDHLKRDVVFKKGFMSKQGKKFKHFHERYFILWSNGLMNYYSKEHTLFANYTEKSKEDSVSAAAPHPPPPIDVHDAHNVHNGNGLNSNGNMTNTATPTNEYGSHLSPIGPNTPNTLNQPQHSLSASTSMDEIGSADHQKLKSPVQFSSLNTPSASMDESGDEMSPKEVAAKHKRPKAKRKSTLRKLGLKSDVIRPKGIIDINDLIETQFLEFTDNTPGWALVTPEREWKFKCKSDRERREWIAAVHAVNYGISPFDFKHLGMDIKYQHDTMLLSPAQNAFIKENSQQSTDSVNAVAQGWMYKLGAAVRGLEKNYWRKRWVSLYKKPARLAYAQHPYSASDLMDDIHDGYNSPHSEFHDDFKTESGASSPKNGQNATPSAMAATNELGQVMGHMTVQPLKSGVSSNGAVSSRSNEKKKKKKSNVLKGEIDLNEVTNIIKIGNNDIIKNTVCTLYILWFDDDSILCFRSSPNNQYRAPTVHVFALITEARTWVFACKTAEECSMWYDRIRFFIPNQWMNDNADVNVEELLRMDRVKTMVSDEHGKVGKKKGKKTNGTEDTVMSKLLRKVSNAGEKLGIIEQYSTISGVQPKGTITDYKDAVNMIGHDEKEEE